MHEEIVDPVFKRARVGETADPHGAAADLVLVGRADAAAGRADALVAAPRVARAIEPAVRRQDQRGIVGELQILRRDVEPLPAHRFDLVEQGPGIDDDAVADDRQLSRADDTGWQQAQLVFDIADDERVAGVGAALKPHDDIGALRQPVDDLALALVAPLSADHRDIAHGPLPRLAFCGGRGRPRPPGPRDLDARPPARPRPPAPCRGPPRPPYPPRPPPPAPPTAAAPERAP